MNNMTELGISRIRPTIERRQQSAIPMSWYNAIQAQARGYVNATAVRLRLRRPAGALSRAFSCC